MIVIGVFKAQCLEYSNPFFLNIDILDYFWNLNQIIFKTPLIFALENGRIQIAKLLLSHPGIEINNKPVSFLNNIHKIFILYVLIFQIEIILCYLSLIMSYIFI